MNGFAIFLLMIRILLAIACRVERKRRMGFEARFPPITDNEFASLCPLGVDPAVALRVRRVLSDCLCVEYERIYPTARLMQDLGAE